MKEFKINLSYANYLVTDHQFDGVNILPGSAYLDIIARCLQWQQFHLSKIAFPNTAAPKTGDVIVLRTRYEEESGQILIYYEAGYKQVVCFKAIVTEPVITTQLQCLETDTTWVSMQEIYRLMKAAFIEHGEFMQVLGVSQINAQLIRMRFRLSSRAMPFLTQFYLHPALLDGALLAITALNFDKIRLDKDSRYLLSSIDRVQVYGRITTEEVIVWAQDLTADNKHFLRCRVQIFSSSGELLLVLEGLTAKRCARHQLFKQSSQVNHWFNEIYEDLNNLPEPLISNIKAECRELALFNQGLGELEHFCYHLIKHKLAIYGLLFSEHNPDILTSLTDYKDYFIALIRQLKDFEKKQELKTKDQIKTWDNLLQLRMELCKKFPAILPFLNLLAVAADNLVLILRGEKAIHEVLFPYGRDNLVRAIYQHRDLSQHNEKIVNSLFHAATFGLMQNCHANKNGLLMTLEDLGRPLKMQTAPKITLGAS